MRESDGIDSLHGRRAGELLKHLAKHPGIPTFDRKSDRFNALYYAISKHNVIQTASLYPDPMVGICLDADRLNLWRLGKRPQHKYLTTDIAKTEAASHYGKQLAESMHYGTVPEWDQIEAMAVAAKVIGHG